MTVSHALSTATLTLKQAGIDGALRDARIILAHVLQQEPGRLILIQDEPIDAKTQQVFLKLIGERCNHRPVSQIIAKREFWGRDFLVTGAVLDPRPETETIIAHVLQTVTPKSILDLGTGSGVLALTLLCEFSNAIAVAVDVSEAALDVAKTNAKTLGVADRVSFTQSDWFQSVTGSFDLIVSNPPYITSQEMDELQPDVADWEPHIALHGGPDGLKPYRKIKSRLDRYLTPDGTAILEHGAGQGRALSQLFSDWQTVSQKDMNGHDRVLIVKKAVHSP